MALLLSLYWKLSKLISSIFNTHDLELKSLKIKTQIVDKEFSSNDDFPDDDY